MQTLQRPSTQEILSGADHPLAAAYKRVQAFIDSLPRRGSSPVSRLYAERGDQGTFAEVFPPVLTCRWVPGLFPDLGGIQPTGDAWLDYLERVVEAGAPKGTLTGNLGYWTLGAGDPETNEALARAAKSHDLQYRPVDDTVQYRAYDADRWERIHSLVEEVFGAPDAAAETPDQPAAAMTTAPPTADPISARVVPVQAAAPVAATKPAPAASPEPAQPARPKAARLPMPATRPAAKAVAEAEATADAVPWAEDVPAPAPAAKKKKPAPSPPRRRSRQNEKESDVLEFSFT